MSSKIIDSKNPAGKRISVSIPILMWNLFDEWHCGNGKERIIEGIKDGSIPNSEKAQERILFAISRPSLINRIMEKEDQRDIFDD